MNVAQGNLGLSAWGLFTPMIVTHVSIRTSDTSSIPYETPSQAYGTLSYRPGIRSQESGVQESDVRYQESVTTRAGLIPDT